MNIKTPNATLSIDIDVYKSIVSQGYKIYTINRKRYNRYEVIAYKENKSKAVTKFIYPNAMQVFNKTNNYLDVRRSNLEPHYRKDKLIRKEGYTELKFNSRKYGKVTVKIDDDIADKIIGKCVNVSNWNGNLYAQLVINNKNTSLHRFVMNADSNCLVDHINQDTLDNRRTNLRFADKSLNAHNSKLRVDNTSGFTGVYKRKNKWISKIMVHQKEIHIGTYNTPEEANNARKEYLNHLGILVSS